MNTFIVNIPNPRKIKYEKIHPQSDYVLNFYGCSKGNPGPSGIGAVIWKNGQEIWSASTYLGDYKTQIQAEYLALLLGLDKCIELRIDTISVLGDSLLIINQLNGIHKVTNKILFGLYDQVCKLTSKFKYIEFVHIYKEQNARADYLSNLAFEDKTKGFI
jgi:ribonuclease HI